ncbi:MAG: hypothetical protein EPN97_01005 [Alphaproteobacteria bacterium]|nr:MAG: hypothetical protein EPN97_01005 [Alphaproteobacteria bacterium]
MPLDSQHVAKYLCNYASEYVAAKRGELSTEFSRLVRKKHIDISFGTDAAGEGFRVYCTPRFRKVSAAETAVLKEGLSRLCEQPLEGSDIIVRKPKYGVFA